MRYTVLVTSLALLSGTTLGYWNGKGAARAEFVNACTRTSFASVYDGSSEEHRRFHCFELEQQEEAPHPQFSPDAAETWVYLL